MCPGGRLINATMIVHSRMMCGRQRRARLVLAGVAVAYTVLIGHKDGAVYLV
jgi:hypothetical protein